MYVAFCLMVCFVVRFGCLFFLFLFACFVFMFFSLRVI